MLGGDFARIGDKKYANFLEFQELYPEFKFVFVGDNGQADYYTALKMIRELPYVVSQVYIHVVQPVSKTYGIS